MAEIKYYIQGISAISPQRSFDPGHFLEEPVRYDTNLINCITPDFKLYIPAIPLRRMSRILRIGMSAAKICMQDAALAMPDGIITGTGYGCSEETIRFLEEILENGEQHLTPTYFTQSTYNALSGAIALSLRCNNYNTTYVHLALAFESGLLDAMMQIADAPGRRFLIGGFDETDVHHYTITTRVGYFKKETVSNFDLYDSKTPGTIQGEGAAFVTLGAERTENAYCTIESVRTSYDVKDAGELNGILQKFLSENKLTIPDIDLVVSGRSGCTVNDRVLQEVSEMNFAKTPIAFYKHLVGEYSSSSSFAVWLIARILRSQQVPVFLLPTQQMSPAAISHVLYINQYMGKEYSMILLAGLDA